MKRQTKSSAASLESRIHELVVQLKDESLPAAAKLSTARKPPPGSGRSLARRIDHTILKPESTLKQVLAVCAEAREHEFASVCVHSHWLPEVVRALKGSRTLPIAVVGFPHGSMLPEAKAAETRMAVKAGAREIDMVVNLGRLKSRDWKMVFEDIRGVVKAAGKFPVKVILETGLLTDDEKVATGVLCELAGAAFVKTSTGFATGGATVEDIRMLRRILNSKVRLKASGGIRTREFAEALVDAGADRLGASSSVAIVEGSSPAQAPGSY
jgi:deoxyribose-phosphate aldolase